MLRRTGTPGPGGNACGMRTGASVLECGCPENVSEVSKSVRRENFSHAFELWRILMNRVGSFGGPKMSFETVSGQPHSRKLAHVPTPHPFLPGSWSAAVLCRFGLQPC